MSPCFTLSNIRKTFGAGAEGPSAAVSIDQMCIPLGGIISIVGGSGSGKTTLLNILGGLERPDLIDDKSSSLTLRLPGDKIERSLLRSVSPLKFGRKGDRFPYQRVSYIFQQGYLLSQASIGINLAMTRRAAALKSDADSLAHLLDMAKLHDRNDRPCSRKKLSDRAITLSGGQQQRINIARAIGRDPVILFADELTSGLDPSRASAVMSELRDWIWSTSNSENTQRTHLARSMIWVTHDYPLACQFSDAVIVLSHGKPAKGCVSPIELAALDEPLNAERLNTWVMSGMLPKQTKILHHSEQQTKNTKETADSSRPVRYHEAKSLTKSARLSGYQIALGNMAAGISLSWMEAFRESPKKKPSLLNLLLQLLHPLLGFSPWVRAMQLSAVLALLMIITYGQSEVIGYFDRQLEDPSLRHVIVQQNTREMQKSVIDDNSLAEFSQSIATSPDEQAVAFGRFTENVDAYPMDTNSINSGFIAEISIGIIHRDEPVYKGLRVSLIDPDAPSCLSDPIADPATLIPYADELALIVSRKYLEDAERMFNIDLCKQPYLDLWDAGAPRTFRIVGFVDALPADGFEQFDALMQIDVWRNWISLVGKKPMTTFSRAAVYFTQANHSDVMQKLNERSFAFDTEIVSKFERLIETSAQLRNTFLIITWLSLAVAIMVATGLVWTYLAQNAKSIAVLRAHDAWLWPLIAAIPFQLILTFLYALIYLAIGVALWNLIVRSFWIQQFAEQVSGGVWQPKALGFGDLLPMLPLLATSLSVMVLAGWLCLFLWRLTHRQLAHELRQAY